MRVALACVLVVTLALGFGLGYVAPIPVQAQTAELFFSEYVEGSSNNKALEIFNGTGAAVDLAAAGYNVQMFFNGSNSAGLTIALSGTVAPGDVFVLAQVSASLDIRAHADQTNSAGWFNGNDAVILRKGTAVIDSIGQIGVNPGTAWGFGLTSTADNTLRRKPSVQTGDTNPTDGFDAAGEWDGFCTDAFDGLGLYQGTRPAPAVVSIGTVQGSVGDTANGRTFSSPLVGRIVSVRGVISQNTLARTSQGNSLFGFFIQNTGTTMDADPNTSDGVFVFLCDSPSIPIDGTGLRSSPQVGDEVIISGAAMEFFNLTEISGVRLIGTVRTDVNVDVEVAPFTVHPPGGFADAGRYWERREGMRARVPENSLVVGARDVFASTMDGEIWLIRPDHSLASGGPAYERRVFRDPHPLDDIPDTAFDNGNGFRIVLGSLGIKARANDREALVAPARTFDRLTAPAVGGVYFSFNKYQIMVDRQIRLRSGPDPSANAPVPGYERTTEVRIATYNVENLYDFRDDPTDGCDFAGNPGCPGVNPPFDYVPESEAAYRQKLRELAVQILRNLHAPDIILVQEVEDQDMCHVVGSELLCTGGDSDTQSKPDALQDLALEIARRGGPAYDTATDRDGADDRGIINAYLFRLDRMELLPASDSDPVLGEAPAVNYTQPALAFNAHRQNPKVLNAELPIDARPGADGTNVFTRPPQVGLFRVWQDGVGTGAFVDLYILNNHFSSTPTGRVRQRQEQAKYNAAIVAALQEADPQVPVVVGGDLNVYPRPDDPSAAGELAFVSDQLRALYDAGLSNLWNTLVAQHPAAAYSYVFEGQAQTLDQLFLTPSLMLRLARAWAAHVNSDYPADYPGDGARGASDHDPQGADFHFFDP